MLDQTEESVELAGGGPEDGLIVEARRGNIGVLILRLGRKGWGRFRYSRRGRTRADGMAIFEFLGEA
jgi:hypothetical protein